jgi:integrase
MRPHEVVAAALQRVCKHFSTDPPFFHAHALRRGTCSMLKKFGLDISDINSHLGWALDSSQFKVYYRFVIANQLDYDFFYDVVNKPIVMR